VANHAYPRLWDELNTTTLGGTTAASATQVSRQSDPIHIEPGNLNEIQSTNVINAGLMRDGSPIPNTGQCFNVQLTDNSRVSWFTPAAGEVWELMAYSANANQAPSSAYVFTLFYSVNDQDGTSRVLEVASSGNITQALAPMFSGSSDRDPLFPPGGQYVGENTTVQVQVDAMQGTTTIDCSCYAMRVR
jgi:hypothetical protein